MSMTSSSDQVALAPVTGELRVAREQATALLVRLICQPEHGMYTEDAGYGVPEKPVNRYRLDVRDLITRATADNTAFAEIVDKATDLAKLGHEILPDVTVKYVVRPGGLTAEVLWTGYWTVGRTMRLTVLLDGRKIANFGSTVAWTAGTDQPSYGIAKMLVAAGVAVQHLCDRD